jgi:hypothetical protein
VKTFQLHCVELRTKTSQKYLFLWAVLMQISARQRKLSIARKKMT